MRRIPFEIWLAALVMIAHLYAALVPANSLLEWYHSDDAFYYFKTAQNIAEGRGITFDGLGRASGFHPLWMALMVPVFALAQRDLILPLRIVVLLSGLLNAGTAVLLYRLTRRVFVPAKAGSALKTGAPFAAAFVGLLWAFHPLIHGHVVEMGLESVLSAFLLAQLLYRTATVHLYQAAHRNGQEASINARGLAITGLVGALAVLARLDNIFLVLIIGVWLVVRPARMRYLLVSDVTLVALGVLWSYMARVGFGPVYAQAAGSALWMVAAALVLRCGLYFLAGLYRAPAAGRMGLAAHLLKAAGVSALASALLAGVMLALQALGAFDGFPRLALAYEAGFAMAALLASRLVAFFAAGDAAPPAERGWKALLFPPGGPCPEFLWRPSLARAASFFAPIALLLALYVGAHMAYFGTPSPVSGQIKRWWGTLPNPIYGHPVESLAGLAGFTDRGGPWGLLRDLAGQPAAVPEPIRLVIFGGLALALVALRWQRARRLFDRLALFPLFAGGFIQLISYTGTGYLHTRDWYWVSNMLLITLLVGVLSELWLNLFPAQAAGAQPARSERWARAGVVGLCVLVVAAGSARLVKNMPAWVSAENEQYYATGARELEAATEPGARIGSTGGGVIAYFVQGRTIINLDGLMNTTDYFHALQAGQAPAYLDALGLDYIYATEYVVTSSDPYFQFKGRLEKIGDFWGSTLFRWLPGEGR